METSALLEAWPIAGPWQLEPATRGINNQTWFVQTPSGRYVLRVYGVGRHPGKIRYELDVLGALSELQLSFAVPAPMPTRSGDRILVIPGPDGDRYATLTPSIPGSTPDDRNLAQTYGAGAGLGELTAALGRIHVSGDPAVVGRYADLSHPAMPEPLSVPEELPLTDTERTRIARLLRAVKEALPDAMLSLPQQPIHGDYVGPNLLMESDRVTGVLDFEFACHEFRALDLAMGLWGSGWGLWGTGDEWPQLEHFSRGYLSRQTLTRAELEALPFLIHLRQAGSFVHWAGRYLDGNVAELPRFAVAGLLQAEDWLQGNGAELVRRMISWAESAPRA